ncbi:caspase domain-containing protein [Mucor lusitanicus]
MAGNVPLMIYIESLETRLRNMEVLLEKMQPEDQQAAAAAGSDQPPMKKKVKREISPSVEIPKSVEHSKVVRFLGSSSGYYLVRNILSTEEEDIDELQSSRRRSSSLATTAAEADEHPGPLKFKKINVIDDDIMFVRDKTLEEHADQLETDKLDLNPAIAPKSLVSELITRFFRMDHASLPIIDKEPFMDAYEGRIQPPPATILIYAICTHTCILLPTDDPIFKNAGLDRDDLFDTLVEHTTNLVKKEYLTPRLATIQALVLLCAYPACDKSFYRNWLRAGMAVRMAQELGLHRTLEKLPLTQDMFEARKRLWFCVYITDRWACAVMGRPLAIADADCDIDLPHVNGGPQGTKDYSLFINFVKLSGILGEVLRRIYSPKARSQGYKNITTYHTKLDVLPDLFDEASQRCTEAAKHAIDIARLLTPTQVVQFGWNFAGYAVFQASLIHVYNCTSSSPEIAKQAREYVKICVEECIKPMGVEMTNAPQHALPLIQTLMDLIGVKKEESTHETMSGTHTNPPTTTTTNNQTTTTFNTDNNTTPFNAVPGVSNTTFLQPQQPLPQQPSPMSVHAIVSDWNQPQDKVQPEPFVPSNVPTAAWQTLFASAATPFFDNESDWQNTLAEARRQTTHHTSSYSSSSYGYSSYADGAEEGDDSNDPHFTEEDYNRPNPNYPQPPESKHNPGPDPGRGKKRALLIGINYTGTSNELNDDREEEKFRPTRSNIIAAMQWLVNDAEPDDSGHGGRVHDVHSDEDDSFDETIYPLDFQEFEGDSGQLKDDDMHDLLVKPLPPKCRLTCIFDSCHSGTVLDLPFVYSTRGEIKEQNLFKHAGQGIFSAGIAYARGDKDGALSSIMSLGKQLMEARNVSDQARRKNTSQADVIMFSGCKDDQTSADANEAGKATGAMSYAFTTTLRKNPNQSYQELLNSVRDILRDKYSQRPQMSSSHPIDVNLEFQC